MAANARASAGAGGEEEGQEHLTAADLTTTDKEGGALIQLDTEGVDESQTRSPKLNKGQSFS